MNMSESLNQESLQFQTAQTIVDNLFNSPYYKSRLKELNISRDKAFQLTFRRIQTEDSDITTGDDYNSNISQESTYNETNLEYIIYENIVDTVVERCIIYIVENIKNRNDYNDLFGDVQNLEYLVMDLNNPDDNNQNRIDVFQEEIEKAIENIQSNPENNEILSKYEYLLSDVKQILEDKFLIS